VKIGWHHHAGIGAEADDLLAVIAKQVERDRIEKQRANAVNQHGEASDKKLSQPEPQPQKLPEKHHANITPTKAAELFNTNRTTSPACAWRDGKTRTKNCPAFQG
jgi:hypothetical protein